MKEEPSLNGTNITKLSMTNPSIPDNNAQLIKGKSPSLLQKFMIVAIILILMSIICIVIVFSVKSTGNKNKPKNPIILEEPPSTSNSSSPSSSDSPWVPDDLPVNDRYKEAEQLLESKEIEDNHNILHENCKSISDSLEDVKNTKNNLNPISPSISYTIPDFLNNSTDNSLKTVKNDITLYNSKYKELTDSANNLTLKVSDSLNNLTKNLENIKYGEYKIVEDFENNTISYSFPLTLINSIRDSDDNGKSLLYEHVQKYKDEIGELNSVYNKFFNYIKHVLPVISINMKEIPNSVKDTNDNLEKSKFY